MIRIFSEIVVALSAYPAISLVAKGTVVLALGLIGAWFARRSRAAVRHAFLASTFIVLLALPIASFLARPVPITVPVVKSNANPGPPLDYLSLAYSSEPAVERRSAAPVKSGWSLIPLSMILLCSWLVGAVYFTLLIARALLQVRSLRRCGLPWRHGQAMAKTLAPGIRRSVEVLLHESFPGPMTCGVLKPVIFLPADAPSWNNRDLERALIHELEHVRRCDWAIHCLARTACAAYWFHPLVWAAWRQLTLEAERSCDDAVLKNSEATAYADQLVGLARRRSVVGKSPVLAMASRSDLAARVSALLDGNQRRGPVGTLLVAACIAAVAIILTMSPLRMVAAPRSTQEGAQLAPSGPTFDAASVKPSGDLPRVPRVSGRLAGGPGTIDPGRITYTTYTQGAVAMALAQVPSPVAPAPEALKFDVASVKVVDPKTLTGRGGGGRGTGGPGTSDPGRFSIPATTMMGMLMKAFGAEAGEILGPAVQPRVGAPFYSVIATMPPDTTKAQFQTMFRNLLVERFHLVVHHETRNYPAWELVVDKNGPKLREATPQSDDGPMPAGPSLANTLQASRGNITTNAMSMEELAQRLARALVIVQAIQEQKPGLPTPRVVDRTGLTGKYAFSLDFTPPGFIPGPDSPANDLQDMFVALRNKLGLRLNKIASVPVDVIVVDSVDTVPADN